MLWQSLVAFMLLPPWAGHITLLRSEEKVLWVPAYEKRLQISPDPDESNLLDKKSNNRIQSIVGTIIYYLLSVDPTMPRAINEIPRVQSQPTRDTAEESRMLPDSATTYLNSILCYKSSFMVLHLDSDSSYLAITEARSYYAGHFYLSYWPSPSPIKPNPDRNGPIHTECKKSEICFPL